MKHTLLVGSSSASRQQLLKEAAIPFMVVPQNADETKCDWGMPLQQVVEQIAAYKMEHVIMPVGEQGQISYVLTADTLSQDSSGAIVGKPASMQAAIEQIRVSRAGMITGTAFCLEKRRYDQGAWDMQERVMRFVSSHYQFDVPEEWIDRYFALSNGYQGSGAIAIEGFGSLFLKEMRGSYSAVVGLPLYELREALSQLGFFSE